MYETLSAIQRGGGAVTLGADTVRPHFATVAGVAAMFATGSVEFALGVRPVAVAPGRAVFEVPLSEGARRPDGRVDPTLMGVLADCAGGIAVFSTYADGTAGVTAELRVDHVAPPAPEARALTVEGTVLRAGAGGGQAGIRVRDDRGVLVAVATALMACTPGGRPEGGGQARPRAILPIGLLGPDRAGKPAGCAADVAVDPAWANAYGALHGGVVLGLAQVHQERVLTALGRGDRHTGLSAEYLRPVRAERLEVRTEVVRRSTRFCALRTEVVAGTGVVLARMQGLATGADLGA